MGKLILVRHGRTTLNRPGEREILRSWLNVPLNETGFREAEETAEKLREYPIEAVYSSDLRRARQMTRILCRGLKVRVTVTRDLRPWNLGIFGGERVRDVLPFLNLLTENPTLPAPGGESFNQFYERYNRRLMELLQITEAVQGYVLAVTHVRNLLAATSIIEGRDKNQVPIKGGPKTGMIAIVERDGGRWTIRREDGSPVAEAPPPPQQRRAPVVMTKTMPHLQIASSGD
ncbi:MAG TPA: histidine phosphatase family protein [Terriglobales bacterium]|nr:histidine phosphatase family protein [Terriglobales bacterium]